MRTVPEIFDMLKKSLDNYPELEEDFKKFEDDFKEREEGYKKALEKISHVLQEKEDGYKKTLAEGKNSILKNDFDVFDDAVKKEEENYKNKLKEFDDAIVKERNIYEEDLKRISLSLQEIGEKYKNKLAGLLNDLQNEKNNYKNAVENHSNVLLKDVVSFENEIKDHIEELKCSVGDIKYSDFFPDSTEDLNEDFNTINNTLNIKIKKIDSALSIIENIVEDSRPLFAVSAYEKCLRFKDNIDLLEDSALNKIPSSFDVGFINSFHGFRASEKLNILLAGGFSTGKTTFTRRLIKGISGATSSYPETASIIIHRDGTVPSISMEFRDKIVFSDDTKSADFEKFLREYDLKYNFIGESNNTWIPKDKTLIEDRWDSNKVMDFMKRINSFPEVFKRLTWTHAKSSSDNDLITILNFADICDMPGIAGDKSHDAVIDYVFDDSYCPDIILYLVDPNETLPCEDEVYFITKLINEKIVNSGSSLAPDFYWVFQKPSSPSELEDLEPDEIKKMHSQKNEWLEKKAEVIGELIKTLSKDNGKFEKALASEETDSLKNTYVIDARGGVKDSEQAQNAVASALLRYYMTRGDEYIKNVRKLFTDSPKLPEVLNHSIKGSNGKQENPVIEQFLLQMKDASDKSYDNFKNVLLDTLCVSKTMPEANKSNMPTDMYNILKSWHSKIIKTVEDMADKSSKKDVGFIKKKMSGLSIKLGFLEKDPREASLDFLTSEKSGFLKMYAEEIKWQEAVYLAQAYNWIAEAHNGNTSFHFINEIGNDILRNLTKELGEIKTLAESSHYIKKVIIKDNDEVAALPLYASINDCSNLGSW